MALCFICCIKKGEPRILESDKCAAIGWFTLEEMEQMDLALTARHRLKQLREKYPIGIPNFYTK